MLPLFLKYRQACLLTLCALLGLACGHLVAILLGMRLNDVNRPQTARTKSARVVPASDPAADLAYILQHNLFDSASRTNVAPTFSLRHDAGEPGVAALRAKFELIGMVAAGKRSIAVLRSGPETKTYRPGEQLPGGGKIEEIVRHQVKIRNADLSLTILTMHEGERTAPAGEETQTGTGGAGVRAAGENRWVIPRSAAESVRSNLGEQLQMAQMQPSMIGDRTIGFVIKRITPGTLLAHMGLRRGDVIKRVNNMPIDSPEKALQILQQLREAREINIDLEREGKPLSFTYAIE